MRYTRILLLLLILMGPPVAAGAQPLGHEQERLDDRTSLLIPSPAVADSVADWSWRGQLGLHWTEGARDLVLLTAQHDLLFQAPPYEAYCIGFGHRLMDRHFLARNGGGPDATGISLCAGLPRPTRSGRQGTRGYQRGVAQRSEPGP